MLLCHLSPPACLVVKFAKPAENLGRIGYQVSAKFPTEGQNLLPGTETHALSQLVAYSADGQTGTGRPSGAPVTGSAPSGGRHRRPDLTFYGKTLTFRKVPQIHTIYHNTGGNQ